MKVNNLVIGLTDAGGMIETAEVYLIGQKIEFSATKAPLNPFDPKEMTVSTDDIIINMIAFGMSQNYFCIYNLVESSHRL